MSPLPSAPFANHRRFYCSALPHPRLSERFCTLDAEQTRHARKVMRCRVGDAVELFDGEGGVARAVIQAFDAGHALCQVAQVQRLDPPRPRLSVATAIPKGPRADQMIHLLSQFGADRVIPLLTERAEVQPRTTKLERFARAAVESAKQSQRAWVMQVEPQPWTLEVVLKEAADVRLIAAIGDFALPDLDARLRAASNVLVLIGPVGDWTDQELAAARAAGFASWTLNPNVLRVEAAAAAATAVLRYLATTPNAAATAEA